MTEAICKRCRHLRETTVAAGREHYMACGWPVPALPAVMLGVSVRHDAESEAQRWITRKLLNEQGEKLAECLTFSQKEEER